MSNLLAALNATSHPNATTAALQRAVDAAGRSGGIVEVPPGTWVITTLMLRSNMTLRLARGATLKAHTDLADYPHGRLGHNKDRQPYHLIWAEACENLTVEGDGTIDGNGMAFWDEPIPVLKARGVDVSTIDLPPWFPREGPPFWRAKKQRISPMMEFDRCRHVVLRDFRIHESPGWTVHLFCCDQVRVDGLTLDNHDFGPNNDGLDINGCRDVIVSNCRIYGCDDNIIVKATADARSSERIVVTNCVFRSQCAALGLGAETVHDIRDIAFTNCVCNGVQRPVQIEMWEPGLVENVVISNLTGNTLVEDAPERVIYLDIQQHRKPEPILGRMRNIVISNIAMTTRGRLVLTAQDGAMIEDVTIRDVQLTYPEIGDASAIVPKHRSNQLSNYSPESRAINSVLVADNVDGLHVANLSARMPPAGNGVPTMHGVWCRNVRRGHIDCPRLVANSPDVDRVHLRNSDVRVV